MIRDCLFLPAQNPNRQQQANRQLNGNSSGRKLRFASAHPTPPNPMVKEAVEETEDWETEDESGKE